MSLEYHVPYMLRDQFLEFSQERSANLHKLRLRRMYRESVDVHPRLRALEYFKRLDANIVDLDMIECYPLEPWAGGGWDIVVEFRTLGKRFEVYDRRTDILGGLTTVCDELGPERIFLWESLAGMHGDNFLHTSLGKVVLYLNYNKYVFLYTRDYYLYQHNPTEYKCYRVDIPAGGY